MVGWAAGCTEQLLRASHAATRQVCAQAQLTMSLAKDRALGGW
eukprot:CAMPEP_0202877322 /NCGR_PEP_ID=MMETSP1391-20130828/30461_1 /ASSEMBLY_ACC=CAM_ASM_000867 /TAXON_ID=1034604 /ORGANISM="Chlamydomonas leiostraca, Strain SAG 11-49" /LENGTH=42 /DNA_ID= /DNA_START= /DNA_END= /DNA_ORIENTATION=